jgi:hypothetical protein
MAHTLYVNKKNISHLVGSVSWESNVDTLGVKLEFDFAFTDINGIPKNLVTAGDLVVLRNNNKEIFRGMVVVENANGRSPRKYTCFDFAFHLNKSKTIIQFNKDIASQAIEKVLNRFKVPHKITTIPVKISKIYKQEYVSDVIKDILSLAKKELGIKYRLEMRGGTLYIEKQKDLLVKPQYTLISNPSRSRSIEEMKNSILIVSDGEKSTKIISEAKDNKNISKYGLLQEIETVDKKDIAKARNIANNLLSELNKVKEDNSIELLGDDNVRAGRILKVNEPITGIVGEYLITDCKHIVTKGTHKMSLTLGVV